MVQSPSPLPTHHGRQHGLVESHATQQAVFAVHVHLDHSRVVQVRRETGSVLEESGGGRSGSSVAYDITKNSIVLGKHPIGAAETIRKRSKFEGLPQRRMLSLTSGWGVWCLSEAQRLSGS